VFKINIYLLANVFKSIALWEFPQECFLFFIYKNLSIIKWICPRLRLMSIQKVEERGYPNLTAAGFTEHVPPSKIGDLEDFMSNHPPTCD